MMKAQRLSLAVLLALGLLLLTVPAGGFMIEDEVALNRVSQIVHLKGSSTSGEFLFNDLKRIMPDGQEVPFLIPKNHSLLLVRFYFDFKPDTPPAGINIRILPFALWLNNPGLFNGIASGATVWPVGVPIGGPTDSYKVQAVFNNVVVPGALTVQITGMLIYPPAATFELLLLV